MAKGLLTHLVSDLECDHSNGADYLEAVKQLFSKLENTDTDF